MNANRNESGAGLLMAWCLVVPLAMATTMEAIVGVMIVVMAFTMMAMIGTRLSMTSAIMMFIQICMGAL